MIVTWPVIGALLGGVTVSLVAFLKRRAAMVWSVAVAIVAVAIFLLIAHEYTDSLPLWVLGWIVGTSVAVAWTRQPRPADQSQPPISS